MEPFTFCSINLIPIPGQGEMSMKRLHIQFFIALGLFFANSVIFANRWTPEMMIQYKRLGKTAISEDGKFIAYEVSVPLVEGEKSEFHTQIWLLSTYDDNTFQLTQGATSSSMPQFSSDSKWLAFLSSRGKDKTRQLFIIPIGGGEAIQLTDENSSISRFEWSPDGSLIAFTMTDPETEEDNKRKKEKRDWKVIDQDYKYSHLYAINTIGKKKIRRLTKGDMNVGSFDWSPDGNKIVFDHTEIPGANSWASTDISIVGLASGSIRKVIDWSGLDASPKFSKDGKMIAFVSDGDNPTWGREHYVYTALSSGIQKKRLPATPSKYFSSIEGWSPDGNYIIVQEPNKTSRRYFFVPTSSSGTVSAITIGEGIFSNLSYNQFGQMVFVHEGTEVVANIYTSNMGQFKPVKLTNINSEFQEMNHGKTDIVRWRSNDGLVIEGLLTYPINYRKGKKVPLILNIHGGPAGVFTESYTGRSSVYPIQAFAQKGYAVLRPNPRGSSGYSKEFRFANRSDWGGKDYQDLMSGVDYIIKMGVADPENLFVMGWSYGGYMTSAIVTKTQRFKAASVGAGVPNLIGMLTTDIHDFIPWHFEGEFYNNVEKYIEHSPLFNAGNVITPSQVIHGEKDVRVPVAQGYEFYRAIKRKGVETEMIVYPRMPHGIREPKFIQHCGESIMGWFEKYRN